MHEECEEEITLTEHWVELRRRILYVLSVFMLVFIGSIWVVDPVYDWLIHDTVAIVLKLHAFSFWDGISIYMKMMATVSTVITLPFTLYQLWRFVSPGLKPSERQAALRYIPYVLVLFLLGLIFAYKIIFPMSLGFSTSITQGMGIEETYGIAQYFSFMFNIVLPVSLLFEMPLVIMFLTRIRLLNPDWMRKKRRIAYFLLVFIAVVITPPDFISDVFVSLPLLLLYEGSVFLSALVYRKQLRRDIEVEIGS